MTPAQIALVFATTVNGEFLRLKSLYGLDRMKRRGSMDSFDITLCVDHKDKVRVYVEMQKGIVMKTVIEGEA